MPIEIKAHRISEMLTAFFKVSYNKILLRLLSVVYHDLVPICVDRNLKQDCLDGFISATGVNIFVQHSLGSSIITN